MLDMDLNRNQEDPQVVSLRRQTLMFTATWPDAVKKIAEQFTTPDAVHVRIGDGGGVHGE